MLQVVRSRYTSEVVTKASKAGIEVSHDYQNKLNTIPLPATFSIDIAQHIGNKDSLLNPKLYSNHPFPWRPSSKDAFQTRALNALIKTPKAPYFEFISESDGQNILRYAVADLMLPDCVSCHNNHTDSPKTDWKVGNVRGALEVAINIDQVNAQSIRGEFEAAILVITIISLCGLFFTFAHRRLHQESKSHLARFQAVFKSSPDAIITIDSKGILTSFNPTAEKMFGYQQNQILGKNISLLMPAPDKLKHDHYISKSQKTGKKKIIGIGSESWGQRKDGSQFPVDIAISEIEYGYEKGFSYIIKNISRRKQMEETLVESEKQYRDLYDNAPNAYVSIKFADHSIVRFNGAFAKLTGYSPSEIEGSNALKFIPDTSEGLDVARQIRKRNKQGDNIKLFETQILRKNGEVRWASVSMTSSFDEKEEILERLATLTDITALKDAQLSAEAANQAKSRFLSSMSHELRTPLNSILGFAQILKMSHKQPLTEQQKSSVNHIMQGGYHLLALVNGILNLAKIEAGKVEILLRNESINPLLDRCLDMVQTQADEKHIKLKKLYPDENSITIKTDTTSFKQVILNLLSNAIKYNRESGQVSIGYKCTPKGVVHIEIEDTGCGIPSDRMYELFQPFSRLGAEDKGIEGTGIGLKLSKELVEMMEGDIGIESQQDIGTKVWVEFPLG